MSKSNQSLKPDTLSTINSFIPSSIDTHWEYKYSLQPSYVEGCMSQLLGRCLTLADATLSDARQCKAFKDIVKRDFNKAMSDIRACAMPEGMGEAGYTLRTPE